MWFFKFGFWVALLWASAGFSDPVRWSMGSIIFSDGAFYLPTSDGQKLRINGLELPSDNLHYHVVMTVDGKSHGFIQKSAHQRRFKEGEELPGTKAQLVHHRNETYLAFFQDDPAMENGTRVFFWAMKALVNSTLGEITIQEPRVAFEAITIGDLNFPSLEWFVASNEAVESPNFHLFLYDREAARLYFGVFSKANRKDSKQQLIPILSLPDQWLIDQPFSQFGELRYSVNERSLALYSHESEKPLLNWSSEFGFRQVEEMTRPRTAREIKLSERMAWQTGLDGIVRQFNGQSRHAPEAFKDVITRWIDKGIATGLAADYQLVGVSQTLKRSRPELMNQLVEYSLESIHQRLTISERELPHTLIHFPGTTDSIARLLGILQTVLLNRPVSEPVYVVIDASNGDAPFHQNATEQLLMNLNALLRTHFQNEKRIARMIIFCPEKLVLSQEANPVMESKSVQLSHLSKLLPATQIPELIAHALFHGKPSFSVESEKIQRFLTAVEASRKDSSFQWDDLDRVVQLLRNILDFDPGALDADDAIQNSSRAYLRLSGNRAFEPISPEAIAKITRIPQQFSANSPLRGPTHFHARDLLLNAIQDQLLAFELFDGPTGSRKFLPLFFMGDPGTGKTSLAMALASYLGGATEVVNASEIKDQPGQGGRSLSFKPEEEVLHEMVEAKIARLWLRPSALKFLIIDEAHSVPAFLKSLLAATGDGDSKTSQGLNFDGLVVILAMNIDDKSRGTTTRLGQLSMNHEEYPELLHRLFVDTFSNLVSRDNRYFGPPVDPKHIEALASRVLTGLYYFAPITHEKQQAESLIYSEVEALEARTHARIIIHPQALEVLKGKIRSYGAGNFRTAERAIRLTLSEGIARYLAFNHDGEALKDRVFLIRSDNQEGSTSRLHFLDLNHSPEGKRHVLIETHRQLVSSMKLAISQLIEQNLPGRESQRSHEDILLTDYRRMLEAFRVASAKPLFEGDESVVSPGLKLDPGPQFSAQKLVELGRLLSNELRELFEEVYRNPRLVLKPDSLDSGSFADKLVEKASLVLRATAEIQKELGLEEEKHEWLKAAVSDFENEVGSGNKEKRREQEIAFLKASLENYAELQEALAKTALENEKQKLIAQWSKEIWQRYQDLKAESPDINLKLIEQFIDQLSSRSETAAREILQSLQDQGSQDRLSRHSSSVESPVSDYVRIASGYYLDALLREAVRETYELSKRPRWELQAPSTNGHAVVDTQCQGLVSRLRKAQETLGPIFKRPG